MEWGESKDNKKASICEIEAELSVDVIAISSCLNSITSAAKIQEKGEIKWQLEE